MSMNCTARIWPNNTRHCLATTKTLLYKSNDLYNTYTNDSNDRWKRLYLVSCAAAPCVWTLTAPTRNRLTYLLTCLLTKSSFGDYWVNSAFCVIVNFFGHCHLSIRIILWCGYHLACVLVPVQRHFNQSLSASIEIIIIRTTTTIN